MPRAKANPDVIDLTLDDEEPQPRGTPPKRRRGKNAPGAAEPAAPTGEQGDGSDTEAGPSRPKKKRGNKADTAPAEKRVDASGRQVRFAPKPSIKTQERMARTAPGSGHSMFLIDRKTIAPLCSPGGGCEEYAVLGATGNVYRVKIGRHLGCSCPDSQKGNVCKHQLFIMLRVLKLPPTNPVVWQRALLPSEADAALSSSPAVGGGDGVLASAAVVDRYNQLSGTGGGAPHRAPIQAGEEVSFDLHSNYIYWQQCSCSCGLCQGTTLPLFLLFAHAVRNLWRRAAYERRGVCGKGHLLQRRLRQ